MAKNKFLIMSEVSQNGLTLQVEDRASGELLAEIQLNTNQLWRMLRGGDFSVEGHLTDRLDRIGKKLEVGRIDVPERVFAELDHSHHLAAAEQWACDHAPGWESYTASRAGAGAVQVIAQRWAEQ